MPLSVFTIELVARNYLFLDSKVSGMIARKTGSLHVHVFGLRPVCAINFLRDQSSNKLINFQDSRLETGDSRLETRDSRLETRDWRLETGDSRLDTRNYRGSSLKAQGSRLEGLSTYF